MTYDTYLIITVLGIFIAGLMTPYWLHLIDKKKKWKRPRIKHNKLTKWNWMVSHPEKLILGDNVDIGAFTYIQAVNGIIIEDDVQIGAHSSIYSKNTIDDTKGIIHIRRGARIGAGSVILPIPNRTLTIGTNSVIGALSLVKQSIPSNSIYAGVPAKPIKEGN